MNTNKIALKIAVFIIAGYFLLTSLVEAQGFFAPFLTAFILALVILPFVQLLERRKLSRTLAALISTTVMLLCSLGIVFLFSLQIKKFVNDWPTIKEEMKPKIEQLQSYVAQNTPLDREDLTFASGNQERIKSMIPETGKTTGYFTGVVGFLGNYLLCFIYIYFLLRYRHKFRRFLIRIFPDEEEGNVEQILKESSAVAPQYLIGKLMLMGILAILYSIGLGISGVDNFILVSLLAAVFTLIPYIGNLMGIFLAFALGYLTSGDLMVLVGILATFTIAQFVESYILEPFIVGDRVDLHPFVVILVVVIGNMLWGVIGMVLAIPVMAIIAVIFLHIPKLKPYGILISKKPFDSEKTD